MRWLQDHREQLSFPDFGGACVRCPTDGEPYCLDVFADQIVASEIMDVTVEPLSECDSRCAGGCDTG